jgi:DNA-binding transcriptional MerR regulator
VKTKIRNGHYKECAKFNMLFKKLGRIHELTPAEITFQNGDKFFEREHQEYVRILKEIKDEGYTVDELKSLNEHYKQQTVLFREEAMGINREIGIAKSLIAEETKNNISEVKRDDVKRQPAR